MAGAHVLLKVSDTPNKTFMQVARWLLMCHDRLQEDLPLTHEFLALMLGVRRSGVTNEIHVIDGVHVIKATRGNIRVLDRKKLEGIAGGSYGIPEQEYERQIGFSIRRSQAAAKSAD